ncbi:MAG: cohesin domain-containing protein [Phycisphaerae bacterium]|nr:cohesin domain-containing protein [Phycisphaerae bacterium]
MRNGAWIALWVLALPLLAAAQDVATLSTERTFAEPNQSVDVKIKLAGGQGLGAIDIVLKYDPAILRYESVAAGPDEPDARVEANSRVPGELAISLVCTTGLLGKGSPASVRFRVLGAAGSSSPLEIRKALVFKADTLLKMPVRIASDALMVGAAGALPSPTPAVPVAPTPVEPAATPAPDPVLPTPPQPTPAPTRTARRPTAARPAAAVATPAPPAADATTVVRNEYTIDLQETLNVALATAGGLLILVLLIGLIYVMQSKMKAATAEAAGLGEPAPPADPGSIPVEGAAVPEASPPSPNCRDCGKAVPKDAAFCPYCGAKAK